MDIFEKQQTIEAIKTVIKGRWFFASTVFLQGIILRLFFINVPIPSSLMTSVILANAFLFNFGFWLYCRRPPEKISNWGIQTVKAMQVLMDQVWISAIILFSGSIGKMIIVLYFVVLMVGVSLYKRKGIILVTLSGCFLFTVLAFLQYRGIISTNPPAREIFSVSFVPGDTHWLIWILLAFYFYYCGSAIFAAYLAGLFKKRETRLQTQKQELMEKTQVLALQTREITQTRDQIQDAFVKSDVARKAAAQARDETAKANLELKKKIDELEKFYKMTVGREVRIVELKSQIKDLRQTIKKLEGQTSQN